MHYEMLSDRDVFVDGIGLLPADEVVTVSPEQELGFEAAHGYRIEKANFPTFVKATLVRDQADDLGKG